MPSLEDPEVARELSIATCSFRGQNNACGDTLDPQSG
jgi:hypothetical protein